VIWLCDLRGFTNLCEALPRDALDRSAQLLFSARMCDAGRKPRRRILKFIGDAMPAIFPIGDDAAKDTARTLPRTLSRPARRR